MDKNTLNNIATLEKTINDHSQNEAPPSIAFMMVMFRMVLAILKGMAASILKLEEKNP